MKKDYIRYQLQIRKYSTNAIEGVYMYLDENDKLKEKSEIILVSGLNKTEGDKVMNQILRDLNY